MGVLRLVILSILVASSGAFSQNPSAELTTTLGTNLDPGNDQASVTFEPLLSLQTATKTKFQLYTAIDRPFNAYENFAVPLTSLLLKQGFDAVEGLDSQAQLTVSFIDLHRWGPEGYMVKPGLTLLGTLDLGKGFEIQAGGGPFVLLSEYTQSTEGKDRTRFGFSERLTLSFTSGRTSIDVHLITEQRLTTNWKNDYRTYEQIAYELNDTLSVGFSHELLGSFVDTSTGRYRSLNLFDERESRVSAFLTVKI